MGQLLGLDQDCGPPVSDHWYKPAITLALMLRLRKVQELNGFKVVRVNGLLKWLVV